MLKGAIEGGVELKAGEGCRVTLPPAEKISTHSSNKTGNSNRPYCKAGLLHVNNTTASSLKMRYGGGGGGNGVPVALLMLHSRRWALLAFLACLCLALYVFLPPESFCRSVYGKRSVSLEGSWDSVSTHYRTADRYILNKSGALVEYNTNMPLIFVGGMPRSGTTLIRVLLDAHPDVRCGEETRIIPRLLSMKQQWMKNPTEMNRLLEGGITNEVIDRAVSSFILEVIVRHGEPAPRLCNKDPFTLRAATYLHQLFPKAKFILMIRDGRAVVHSIITRKVTITGYDLNSYRQCLRKWNQAMSSMYTQCQQLGTEWCLPVYYEQLVLHPRPWLEQILNFLDVPWSDDVLRHDKLVNKPGGISLSMLERSTDQVIKPINMEALTKWVGAIPKDVVRDMAQVAPMLKFLGYDPMANPPDYGKPDSFVLNNTEQIKQNLGEWRAKEGVVEREREALRRKMALERSKNDDRDQDKENKL
ncbi:protein-tyrosine sulfotransferase-like [Tropilaelaps mercedesae]|uniref:Protein-tyrosine sulfotransferase n=1 Tax=Tropilaelaps mercedesae TaxID=418985 RepID=A0A1V9XTR6_9ACAR|nr:protein-tyrosine sulfotransferase-like [Tropilaelaps mercedesae]